MLEPTPAGEQDTPTDPGRGRQVGCGVAIAVAVVVLTLLVTVRVMFSAYLIPSESMTPTLQVGDRILVNKRADPGALQRGDIIIFDHVDQLSTLDEPPVALVSRVIGLPGESVTFVDGRVAIDGTVVGEPWLDPGVRTEPADVMAYAHSCTDGDPCVLAPGEIWVMGDNRTNARDSRYLGPVDQDQVIGRAFRLAWPLGRAGSL